MADVKELNINNTTYDIKAKTVVDQNGGSLKYWTGTKAQYDAIATKDANTLYNITDDTDVTLTLLNLLYPVGSLYIATGNVSVCPLAVLGVGTWQQKANSTLVTGVNSVAPVVGNGYSLGLTDGTYSAGLNQTSTRGNIALNDGTSVSLPNSNSTIVSSGMPAGAVLGITTDATKSGIEANITSTTLSVTIWERIA